MSSHYQRHGITVHAGDCLTVLRTLPDNSVHAVVTDPPYGLSEVGSEKLTTALTAWVNGDRERVPGGVGFMGKEWDAFVPPPAVWDECLRVLKPGGHVLVFAGSRTVDLMGLSIRLAGFEIRDTLQWLYGSGFPKSMDVSKSLDKLAGAEREVVGAGRYATRGRRTDNRVYGEATPSDREVVTAPATDAAREWSGWGTALKPAAEPIILARKPLDGTVARNVLAHGTGGVNVDGCRVAAAPGDYDHPGNDNRAHTTTAFGYHEAEGRQAKPHEGGRFPANVILSHSETCDDDVCDEGCPVAELDAQSGVTDKPNKGVRGRGSNIYAGGKGFANTLAEVGQEVGYDDTGGASRFFPSFRWEAKAPTSERPQVGGVSHPTVKPVDLMRWLVRLVTPPGGLVLDPFAGTGTTGHAARAEGLRAVLIEREPDYLPLIVARLDGRDRTPATATGVAPPATAEPLDLLDLLDEDAS